MTGDGEKCSLELRLRRAAARVREAFRRRQSRDMLLLIFSCVSGLGALVYLQLSWVGTARESRRAALTRVLAAQLDDLANRLRHDAVEMLMPFRAAAGIDFADASGAASGLRESWAQDAARAPGLKRTLFFELPATRGAPSRLRVLDTNTSALRTAQWPDSLHGLEPKLVADWASHEANHTPQWFATWMVYPEFAAISRPLVLPPARAGGPLRVRGHIVLEVDFEHLAETMVMNRLRRDVVGLLGQDPYEVALIWNGELVRVFRPVFTPGPPAFVGDGHPTKWQYELGPERDMAEVPWLAEADWRQAMVLPDAVVAPRAMERGATQRVALAPFAVPYQAAGPPSDTAQSGINGILMQIPTRPRVFLSSKRQHRLELATHRLSRAVEEALVQQYWWNAMTSIGVLALLGIAVALVATGARRASRLAEMRMAFVANVSHELRTPVASMLVIGQNIADGFVGTDRRLLRYGELVRDQAKRLGQMIEDTLLLSRIESGEKPLNLRAVKVGPVVRDALAHVRPLVERTGFELEWDVPEGLANVQADPNALRQSLSNLLTNAVKHAAEGRWLKVEAVADPGEGDGHVEIRVRDRGPGIEPDDAQRVFEPYFRARSAIHGAVPGSGMGLSLASDLVRMMGGRISMQSDPGRGSVFTIRLPVAQSERPGNA